MVTPVRPEPGVTAKAALTRADRAARPPWSTRSTGRSTRPPRAHEAGPLDVPAKSNTTPERISRRWCAKAKDYIPPATSSRWCCRSASRRRSRCRRSRSTARCAGSTRRRSSTSSISAASPIAGSSPEILVRVRDGTVTIRPIAGTRPRGATPHEDKALEDELLADPKERAEHLMLLDLGRNDVGRVAKIGTRRRSPTSSSSSATATSCTSSRTSRARSPRATTRSTRWPRAFRPAPCPARRRCAPWRSSTSWRRRSAASTPAASAISPPPARWTPASCCAPR